MSYSITAAAKFPPQDVVPVSANPAYEQVTLKSVALQENSAYSIVHTVSPPAVAEYEYIEDGNHGNDELSELVHHLVCQCGRYVSIYVYSSS